MAQVTVRLTGCRPMRVGDEAWRAVAFAFDCAVERRDAARELGRFADWAVWVRRHADGRAIVYAEYQHHHGTRRGAVRDRSVYHGVLLPAAEAAWPQIRDAIERVCGLMAASEHAGWDAGRWPALASECIRRLPE
ncbi:MAG TPA: hypothetical protein VMV10_32115 [Pirellulales bacterium]|nr:hypothetical protein [Pirellulales bacterium]